MTNLQPVPSRYDNTNSEKMYGFRLSTNGKLFIKFHIVHICGIFRVKNTTMGNAGETIRQHQEARANVAQCTIGTTQTRDFFHSFSDPTLTFLFYGDTISMYMK